jgi:protein involved in polysaccharide export with SLBB domain
MKILKLIIYIILYLTTVALSQTYEEIQKLRSQYEELKQSQLDKTLAKDGESLLKDEEDTGPTRIIYKPEDLDEFYRVQLTQLAKSIKELEEISSFFDSSKSLTHFGYNLFTDRDTISFFDNMSLPLGYTLGSGDEIIVSLWGEVEKEESSIVNRDGNIFLEDIGIISLDGITISQAKIKIKNAYGKLFSTIKSSSPTTFIDISLGQLKGLNINILGFVKFPGIYALHPFSDPFTALFYAGGIDTTGSLRNIQIIRNGKNIKTIDLYKIIFGDSNPKEMRLLDQDLIFVPPRQSKVIINGEVQIPGYYELIKDETALDLINYSGGITPKASNKSILKRVYSPNNRKNDDESIEYFSIPFDSMNTFIVNNGDSLGVGTISDFHPTITINGWVKHPGQYPFIKNMNLFDLIEISGGLYDESWLLGSNPKEIRLVRYNNKQKTKTLIFDYEKVINRQENIVLYAFDEIQIVKSNNNNFSKYVYLNGEVKSEGIYSIANRSIEKLINNAGGLTSNAYIEGIELYRDTIKVGINDLSMIPIDGDSIYIPNRPGTVTILGSVNNPGPISFVDNLSINEIINLAGGYTIYANRKDVFIIYPNGISKKKTKFMSPKVLEGSTIMVSSSQLVVQQTDFLEVSQQVASIIGSLATVALIINSQKQ